MAIDKANAELRERGSSDVTVTFNPTLFRQPNLSEGALRPAVYRKRSPKGISAGAAVFSDAELGTGSTSNSVVRKPSLSISKKGSISADEGDIDSSRRSRVGTGGSAGSVEMSDENIVFEDENDEDVAREEEVGEVLNVDDAYQESSSSVSFGSFSRDLTSAFRERRKAAST
jgi:hypothetical protein